MLVRTQGLFLFSLACVVACGGRVGDASPATGTVDASPGDASPGDTGSTSNTNMGGSTGTPDASADAVTTSTCARPPNTPPPADAQNAGAVIASLVVAGSSQTQSVFAGFPAFGGPDYALSTTAPGCTCQPDQGIADPPYYSNAGTITIAPPDCGAPLATMPYADAGFQPYTATPSPSWSPGSVVDTTATGGAALSTIVGGVSAFAGGLQTVVPPADLLPAIFGPSGQPTIVPLDQPFVLTWTPEGLPGETVVVSIRQLNQGFSECTCVAPDAAGTLTIPASSLMQTFQASANASEAANLSWSRSVVTRVAAGNQEVDLVGQVELDGSVLFQ